MLQRHCARCASLAFPVQHLPSLCHPAWHRPKLGTVRPPFKRLYAHLQELYAHLQEKELA